MMKKLIGFLAFIFLFALGDSSLLADSPTAAAIIQKMKQIFEPEQPSTRKVTFILKEKEKVTREWVAREVRKKLPDGKRSVLVMLEPEDIRGTAFLIWERENEPNFQLVYLSAVRRVRKIAPVMVYDSFFGTDFTYFDLGFIDVGGTHKLLGEKEHSGVNTYQIETTPEKQWYYSRIITWVSIDNYLPVQRDYYDIANRLWKTQLFEDVTIFNTIPTPMRIRMKDVLANTSTEYDVSEVCYGAAVPDEVFDPTQLSQSLEFPFCKVKSPE